MVRKIIFSVLAPTVLIATALTSNSGPAHAGGRFAGALMTSAHVVTISGTKTSSRVPSPPPRPLPFPRPDNPAPPSGPAKPRPHPDWCQLGTTRCPLLPVPYPN